MTPQRQLIEHCPNEGRYGDCQRTCVAAILDLHPSEVPHFCDNPDALPGTADWWEARQTAWLAERGLACATVAYDGETPLSQVMQWTSKQSPTVPMILLGTSRLGSNHVVVVMDGEIVCDPSGNGIVGPAAEGPWEVSVITVGANWRDRAALSQEPGR